MVKEWGWLKKASQRYAYISIEWHKNIVYQGCSISLRPKVEADVPYSCNLTHVQVYSIDEYTASLKLQPFLVCLLQIIKLVAS